MQVVRRESSFESERRESRERSAQARLDLEQLDEPDLEIDSSRTRSSRLPLKSIDEMG